MKRVYPRLSLHVHSAAEEGFSAKGLGYLRPTISGSSRRRTWGPSGQQVVTRLRLFSRPHRGNRACIGEAAEAR